MPGNVLPGKMTANLLPLKQDIKSCMFQVPSFKAIDVTISCKHELQALHFDCNYTSEQACFDARTFLLKNWACYGQESAVPWQAQLGSCLCPQWTHAHQTRLAWPAIGLIVLLAAALCLEARCQFPHQTERLKCADSRHPACNATSRLAAVATGGLQHKGPYRTCATHT